MCSEVMSMEVFRRPGIPSVCVCVCVCVKVYNLYDKTKAEEGFRRRKVDTSLHGSQSGFSPVTVPP